MRCKKVFAYNQPGCNNPFLQEEETPLHVASSRGNVECVRALLDGGASGSAALDLQDRRGSTPLHLALRRGHVHVAMLLLHAGADFDIQVG